MPEGKSQRNYKSLPIRLMRDLREAQMENGCQLCDWLGLFQNKYRCQLGYFADQNNKAAFAKAAK
jgi:hypothetical protein